ncbi:hypothetical protein [Amycolatopsis magusensis]|uniref:hypothetical protein n=1 Tax=Amycolatopsis magusensis TaxID=882444 RepID=UPI0037B8078C
MKTREAPQWEPPKPHELHDLRERLAEHLRSPYALGFTAAALEAGQGTIRPGGHPVEGAQLLLADELQRLSNASLYYVTPDVTELVQHASRNHSGKWDIQPEDLPSLAGFMVFGAPIAQYVRDDGALVPIVAVSWGESFLIDSHASGIWLTFWSVTHFEAIAELFQVAGYSATEAARAARKQNADLNWDNEIYLPWNATKVATSNPFQARQVRTFDPTAVTASVTTIDWLRVVHAGWIFCKPTSFTDVEQQHLSRKAARRAQRARLTPAPVRVVSVTRKPKPRVVKPTDSSGRTVGVRFPVGPFLRRQAYGPNWSQRRWTVVAGHWRGPEDAPVQISKKVNLVDSPPDPGGL